MESQFHTRREDERSGNNPWERVTDNCDLTLQGVVAGGHDKSRMKQAMINRKADINAGETVVANSFGTHQLWAIYHVWFWQRVCKEDVETGVEIKDDEEEEESDMIELTHAKVFCLSRSSRRRSRRRLKETN